MKERPILFSGEMVRAIIDGRKTQTRRIVKRPKRTPLDYILRPDLIIDAACTWWQNPKFDRVGESQKCPYGKVGDRLWVRETWAKGSHHYPQVPFVYRADASPIMLLAKVWKPSIHMPRIASRIILEIVNTRVERLDDISTDDIWAEGVDCGKGNPTMGMRWENMQYISFVDLWEKINGDGSWALNPWVWVIEFKKI